MYDSNRIPHDNLMFKIIKEYGAREGKDEMGKPNGKFYLDHDAAMKMIVPYLKKYGGFKTDADREVHLKYKVEDIWRSMDVLGSGVIEADQVGRFIKEACGDHTLDLY